MDNIVRTMSDDGSTGPIWKLCDWNESKKALMLMFPYEARWGRNEEDQEIRRVDMVSD